MSEGSGAAGPLEPGESPGFLLWRTTLRWQREIVAALQPLGLTHVQFVVLATVWWMTRDGAAQPSQREVADAAGIDAMMTSQVLRALERRELAVRRADGSDSRIRRLAVTAEGAELAQDAIRIVEAADREFFSRARDQAGLLRVLQDLAGVQPEASPAASESSSAASRSS